MTLCIVTKVFQQRPSCYILPLSRFRSISLSNSITHNCATFCATIFEGHVKHVVHLGHILIEQVVGSALIACYQRSYEGIPNSLITQRSQVRIPPPLPMKNKDLRNSVGPFFLSKRADSLPNEIGHSFSLQRRWTCHT